MNKRETYKYEQQFQQWTHQANVFEAYLDHSLELHWHDYYEMELVTEGTGIHYINNIPHSIFPGSLYLLTPLDMHRIEVSTPLHFISVKMLISDLNAAQQASLQPVTTALCTDLDADDTAFVLQMYQRLSLSMQRCAEYSELYTQALSSYLLAILLGRANRNPLVPGSKAEAKLLTALRFIQENSRADISLADVAAHVGFSKNHFCTIFRQYTACSYPEYLAHCRIRHARDMLGTTDKSVTDIAFDTGFNSLSHFFRVFKKITGTTPQEFRKKI